MPTQPTSATRARTSEPPPIAYAPGAPCASTVASSRATDEPSQPAKAPNPAPSRRTTRRAHLAARHGVEAAGGPARVRRDLGDHRAVERDARAGQPGGGAVGVGPPHDGAAEPHGGPARRHDAAVHIRGRPVLTDVPDEHPIPLDRRARADRLDADARRAHHRDVAERERRAAARPDPLPGVAVRA